MNIPSTDWWDYSLASNASLARTEYDEQSHDVCILFKHGYKKFLLKTGLEVGTDVLLTFKTNVGNDLYMIVCLDDI